MGRCEDDGGGKVGKERIVDAWVYIWPPRVSSAEGRGRTPDDITKREIECSDVTKLLKRKSRGVGRNDNRRC